MVFRETLLVEASSGIYWHARRIRLCAFLVQYLLTCMPFQIIIDMHALPDHPRGGPGFIFASSG